MFEVEDHFHVKIGGNTYIDCRTLVSYKGQSLFTLKRDDETGYLGIYFDIYDATGTKIASVKRNEIYQGDKDAYEQHGSINGYSLIEKATGRVICDIKKREAAHPAELEVSVDLYTPSGFRFQADTDQTNIGGVEMVGCTLASCDTGIYIA